MLITEYGKKKLGSTKFVIVAPHAAGDDLKSGIIASKIACILNGSLVVNYKFIKPTNSRAKENPEVVEDFNRLRWWMLGQKYLWKKKKPEMKIFFKDIVSYCKEARKKAKDGMAVVIYVHGMKSENVGVDIGAGKRVFGWNNKTLNNIIGYSSRLNTGKVTLREQDISQLKIEIENHLLNSSLVTSVGKYHSAWSKSSALQFHKHGKNNDHAVQFEIGKKLREAKNIDYTAKLLAAALKKTFC